MCKHVVKKLPFVIRSFPDQYKTQKMCDEAINTHLSTMEFVPDYYKTQEICDKAVNRCFLAFIYVPDWYKSQEICDSVVSEDPFMLVYPINIKLKECVMKLLMILWQHWNLFLIGWKIR